MFDLHNNCAVLDSINASVGDDTAQVVSASRAGWGSVEFIGVMGSIADANATFSVLVEDSADDSSWAAVDDAFLLGTEAGAAFVFSDDNKSVKIGYAGAKKYVRCTVTPSGNGSAAILGMIMLGAHPLKAPNATQLVAAV